MKLESLKKVHILGIGGTLMGAFAALLSRKGIEVTGSDGPLYPPMSEVLKKAKIQTFTGYQKENIDRVKEGLDLVVVGNVIRRNNPEAEQVEKLGLKKTSLPEFMKQYFLQHTQNLVVAGTHGKTTTSSWLAHVLIQTGKDPSYFVGGVAHDLPHPFHLGGSFDQGFFVLEGDEYDTVYWDKVPKFFYYCPNHVILTSVEFDHADIYQDLDQIKEVFQKLILNIRSGGSLIYCADDPIAEELARSSKVKSLGYGLKEGEFQAKILQMGSEGTEFEIVENQTLQTKLRIGLSGEHNVLNALAVWVQGRRLGIPGESLDSALESFRGVKRRQETLGTTQGITILEDFAHHPTSVRKTLEGLKKTYPKKRLVVAFEPRSATSRRKVFEKPYAEAFQSADLILIAPAFDQSSIEPGERLSVDTLLEGLRSQGKEAFLLQSGEARFTQLRSILSEGDLFCLLSNGGFDGLGQKILENLRKKD